MSKKVYKISEYNISEFEGFFQFWASFSHLSIFIFNIFFLTLNKMHQIKVHLNKYAFHEYYFNLNKLIKPWYYSSISILFFDIIFRNIKIHMYLIKKRILYSINISFHWNTRMICFLQFSTETINICKF